MLTQNEVTVNGGGRQYGTKLTTKGAEVLAACIREGTKLEITEIAVGDGGGAYYEPLDDQTALVHEVWRAEVLACEKSVLNPNTMDIKGVIPPDAGGFVIREMGVFDAAGTLIGVCNTPDMEKTDVASGAGGKLDLIMHLLVTDANAVQVVIKPSLDTVSLKDVQDLLEDKQDKITGQEGQVPVFNKGGALEAQPLEELLKDKQDVLEGEEGQFVGFDKNGNPLPQALPEAGVGRSMAGQTVEPTQGTTVTAGEGAEIFNDYRERTYNNDAAKSGNVASGMYAHAEGMSTTASGAAAHAEGGGTVASNSFAHAEGLSTKSTSGSSHAEGSLTTASGVSAHAEGSSSTASGNDSHAEGTSTIASYGSAHAEGARTVASFLAAHAEGHESAAHGVGAHAEGASTQALGAYSHAEGGQTVANTNGAHAEGYFTNARRLYSHAGGIATVADEDAQTAIGECNVEHSSGYFVIGKGTFNLANDTVTNRANCFRATATGVYASGSYNASGADYAELFEWSDGNPEAKDRAGRFVTLEGKNIRLAGPQDDYILGIVSGNPSVVGDVHDDQWQGMYLTDIFGRPIWEDVVVPAVTEQMEIPVMVPGEGDESPRMETRTETQVIIPAHTERRQKLNPNYDPTQPYIPRSQRPEWDAVGMLGKLVAVDDGSCREDGWAAVGKGGIAVGSEERTRYRVMERLDGNHVRIMIL